VPSQYFVSKGRSLHAVDADTVNHTFGEYRALSVERLNLLKSGNVHRREFDAPYKRSKRFECQHL